MIVSALVTGAEFDVFRVGDRLKMRTRFGSFDVVRPDAPLTGEQKHTLWLMELMGRREFFDRLLLCGKHDPAKRTPPPPKEEVEDWEKEGEEWKDA